MSLKKKSKKKKDGQHFFMEKVEYVDVFLQPLLSLTYSPYWKKDEETKKEGSRGIK